MNKVDAVDLLRDKIFEARVIAVAIRTQYRHSQDSEKYTEFFGITDYLDKIDRLLKEGEK